jgi:membrane protease YdiL (CAAX protease family)
VEAMAWYLFGVLTFGIALALVLRSLGVNREGVLFAEMAALVAAFALGLSWPLFRGQSLAQWRAALGLHSGRGLFREMGCGILGYLAGLPVLALGLLITSLLIQKTGIRATHPISETLTRGWWWVLAAFALASIWAPLTEEIMFRGALFAHLRERFGWWIAAPVVGFIFAIIHPQGWVALPVLGAIGFVFCGIREWRGSIIACITAHALHNSGALLISLLLLR